MIMYDDKTGIIVYRLYDPQEDRFLLGWYGKSIWRTLKGAKKGKRNADKSIRDRLIIRQYVLIEII